MTDAALAERVRAALDASGVGYEIFPCDPDLADTAVFCERYGYPPERSANTILVKAKTGGERSSPPGLPHRRRSSWNRPRRIETSPMCSQAPNAPTRRPTSSRAPDARRGDSGVRSSSTWGGEGMPEQELVFAGGRVPALQRIEGRLGRGRGDGRRAVLDDTVEYVGRDRRGQLAVAAECIALHFIGDTGVTLPFEHVQGRLHADELREGRHHDRPAQLLAHPRAFGEHLLEPVPEPGGPELRDQVAQHSARDLVAEVRGIEVIRGAGISRAEAPR